MSMGHLGDALGRIADGAAGAHDARAAVGTGLDVGRVRTVARRHRTRFAAGAGLAAAAAVGALVLGGAALGRVDGPVAPAVTPDDRVGCGTVLEELVQPDGSPDVGVSVEPRATESRAGDPLSAVVVVTVAGAGEDEAFGHLTALALAREGVVVGVASGPVELTQSGTDTPQRQAGTATVPFTGCGADGEPTETLPPGDYDLVAIVSEVMLADGTTWPAPFVSDPVSITVLEPATRSIACGARLDDLPGQPEGAPEVSIELEVPDPTVQAGEPVVAVVTTTVVMDTSLPHSYSFGVWLVRDGVVVGRPRPGWADEGRPGGTRDGATVEVREVRAAFLDCAGGGGTAIGVGAYDLVAALERVQVGDGPVSAPFLSAAVPVQAVGRDEAGDGEAVPPAGGDEGWSDVDATTIPGDLPLALDDGDRVLRSQAFEDGLRWRVTVSYAGGGDTYERVRDALVASGYTVTDEETDPERPAWTAATLTRGAVVVLVDVSNETGEGFYADFTVQASW